jgi:hypothetical protein
MDDVTAAQLQCAALQSRWTAAAVMGDGGERAAQWETAMVPTLSQWAAVAAVQWTAG